MLQRARLHEEQHARCGGQGGDGEGNPTGRRLDARCDRIDKEGDEAGQGHLQERLGTKVPSITSMARGLPFGADLQYADAVTILRSLEERRGVE